MCVHRWDQVGYSAIVRRLSRQTNLNAVKWGTHDEIDRSRIVLGTANAQGWKE